MRIPGIVTLRIPRGSEEVRAGVNRWTDDDDEVLRQEIFAGTPAAEIAAKIGRTESALRARAYVLRLSLRYAGSKRDSVEIGLKAKGNAGQ